MKTFTALVFLSAFAVYVSANEMAFHRAVFDFLDERHDERMVQILRDQGLPENVLVASDHPEPPEWMVSCKQTHMVPVQSNFSFRHSFLVQGTA